MDFQISNSGPEGSLLGFNVQTLDPATISSNANKSIQGSTITLSAEQYEPGTSVEMDMIVEAVSEGSWISRISLSLPDGVTLHSAKPLRTEFMELGLRWNGEIGEAITPTWGGNVIYQYLVSGETYYSTLELSFDSELTGDVVFNFRLDEPSGWVDPDQVTGAIILTNENPSLRIQNPSSATIATIGQTTNIAFEMLNASGSVNIALQREPNGLWQILASSLDASSGTWPWLVSGEAGPHAIIRITDTNDGSVFRESSVFVVSNNLNWIRVSQTRGNVAAGFAAELEISLDAANLDEGFYSAVLVITTSIGETFTVPREMPVSLEIYSARGMSVRRLFDGIQNEGVNRIVWDGTDDSGRTVSSGVYFGRLVTTDKVVTEKMVLTK